MVNYQLLIVIIIFGWASNLWGQEVDVRLVTGLDNLSYQVINIENNRDEFLDDNSLGIGAGYSYRLNESLSIITGIEFQKVKGKVNASESGYLHTSNVFYSLGIESMTSRLPLFFDLSYLFISTEFDYFFNNRDFSNRSFGHGAKLGINYKKRLTESSDIKLGIYSYGLVVGDIDLANKNMNPKYHDSAVGIITSIQVGYVFKF